MMRTAINLHHRRERLPFAGEARGGKVVFRLHPLTLAEVAAVNLDANQIFISRVADCSIYFCSPFA